MATRRRLRSMILFTADWHIKLGQKNVPVPWACTRYKLFFQQVQDAIKEHNVSLHIIGGDLFDRVPSMDELTLYFDFVKDCNVRTIIFDGNHEATKKNHTFFTNLKRVTNEITSMLGYSEQEILKVSAKTGEGVESLIKEIINLIPPPKGDSNNSLQALVFDSKYDQFKGVIAYVKVVNGELQKGQSVISMGSKKNFEALETGIFSPNLKEIDN